MKYEKRNMLSGQEFIRQLFAEMEDGKVSIEYRPFFDQPYTMTYEMDWTEDAVQNLVQRYDALVAALTRIGKLYEVLDQEENRKDVLSKEEQEVWDIYIRPFAPFDGDLDEVAELEMRCQTEDLDEEEDELLERYYNWYEDSCLERLPVVKCAPTRLISQARSYARLINLKAPESVVSEEGRWLAEEMVLYYHRVQRPKPDFEKFLTAQQGVFVKTLEEIRRGKKETHWMWFVFPQLRGLGQSDMAQTYGLANLEEAKAYLADLILGSRLKHITEELLKLDRQDPREIFGEVDAMKLQASMTLFACADEKEDSVFRKVLQQYFNGAEDQNTLCLLRD